MPLAAPAIMALAMQCAPSVAPPTITAIVMTESQGYELAININKLARQPARPQSKNEAIRTARYYIKRGHSVDLGLGQINSRNMKWLGLTWDTVFDPCTNIAAAGKVMLENYQSAREGRLPQHALRIALSMYNTGDETRGFRNGYVRKVENAGRVLTGSSSKRTPDPIITADKAFMSLTSPAMPRAADLHAENDTPPAEPKAPPPSWDVFARAQYARSTPNREDN